MGTENLELNLVENEEALEESYTLKDNVLKDVLVLGVNSRNNRIYTKECMKEAVGLYNNSPVYIDHSDKERKLDERFGTLVNAKVTDKGIVGDVECLTTHKLYPTIKEAYDNKVSRIGMSHSALGKGSVNAEGQTIVNHISKVISVDLVTGSATTQNLRESEKVEVPTIDLKEQEIVSLKEQLLQKEIKIDELIKEIDSLKIAQSKWQTPVSVPLKETAKVTDLKEISKWFK